MKRLLYSVIRFLPPVALAAVLFTVFAVDRLLWNGVSTAKYFWFAAAMCAVSLLIPFQLSRKRKIHLADILFGVFAGYICIHCFFVNGDTDMHRWLSFLMIPLYVAVRMASVNEKLRRLIVDAILAVVLAEAIWGLLQLYGFVQSNHNLYRITGTLFNPGPYSGFVAAGIPMALSYSLDKTLPRPERWLGIAALTSAVLVLPAAMSRAAWIAAAIGCMPVLTGFKVQKIVPRRFSHVAVRPAAIAVTALFAVVLLAGTYLLKKDSADGRWVIWSASVEAVKERPLFGAGYGRFAAVYGDAQAAYFGEGRRSDAQIMVADSPEYAFNEYVQTAVELGLVGLLLFLLLAWSCFAGKNRLSACHCSLITVLVFAAFSYPFSVLPLGILFIFLLALSAPSSRKLSLTLPVWLRVIGVAVCWGITLSGTCQILPRREAYREWPSLQMLYHAGAYDRAAGEYAALYPDLRHEKQFLFEYGQCLSKTGQFTESNRIFGEYMRYGSDPMVYNCIGNNYKETGEYAKAENMYLRASQTVPNRHYPLYLLMKLYAETGETGKAKAVAETLLKKPVKVPSTAISEMQAEAEEIRNRK